MPSTNTANIHLTCWDLYSSCSNQERLWEVNLRKSFRVSERGQSVTDTSTWEDYAGTNTVEGELLTIDCCEEMINIDSYMIIANIICYCILYRICAYVDTYIWS